MGLDVPVDPEPVAGVLDPAGERAEPSPHGRHAQVADREADVRACGVDTPDAGVEEGVGCGGHRSSIGARSVLATQVAVSAVMTRALVTHHWQIAWMSNSSR